MQKIIILLRHLLRYGLSSVFLFLILSTLLACSSNGTTPVVDLTRLEWKIAEGHIDHSIDVNNAHNFRTIKKFPIFPNDIFPSTDADVLRNFTLVTNFSLTQNEIDEGMLEFNLSGIGENWRIYLNGHLLANEMFVNSDNKITIYRHVRNVSIPIDERYLKSENTLVIHLSGFTTGSRFFRNIFLGLTFSRGFIISKQEYFSGNIVLYLKFMLYSIYLFFGIYHLFVYFRNKQTRFTLYFGLFLIAITLYFVALSDFSFSLTSHTNVLLLVNNIMQPVVVILFTVFINDFLFKKRKFDLFTKILIFSNVPFMVSYFIFPVYYYTSILFLWYFVLIPQIGKLIYLLGKSLINKKEDSFLFLIATFITVSFILWDMFDTMLFESSIRLMQYGFLISLFMYILIIANRFLRWYKKSIELNKVREDQIYKDINSGLWNRQMLVKDASKKDFCSLIIFKILGLDRLNNIYGHSLVDEILQDYMRSMQTNFHAEDYQIYHIYWDEFGFAFHNCIDENRISAIVNRVIGYMEGWKSTKDGLEDVILDIVAGICSAKNISIQSRLINCEMSIHFARDHRLPYTLYKPEMNRSKIHKNNLLWIKKVRQALDEKRISVQYQAIQNNSNNKIEKYEVLVRVKETDGTLVEPAVFLPAITNSKLLNSVTHRVIYGVCYSMEILNSECSININAEQLIDAKLSEMIIRHVEEFSIHDRLVVEILESERIRDYNEISKELEMLRKHGIKIAIDDFGSGYSNFEHIVKLPIDYIKIDGSLIKNIHTDYVSKTLVENIANVCNKLNIKTIAEFVHCREVHDTIVELGVDYSQGYYIAKPRSLGEIALS
jgi:EAL domain-containing protein (putative c-di-GMP-specific phosphodiesterase class I)/GGDEF domain-containing protein